MRRAEARAPEFFPAPLPPPCAVTPMPDVVALAGAAPHYTPPRLDGGRPGTFWFNTELPTAGTGWDIDVVAFHEAVPGHHLQLSRLQLLDRLPALQRQRSLPVFSEGWGLYAEQLAEEAGLYTDDRGLLGAVSASLMRAVRLVVDTGLHAFGWSREQAAGVRGGARADAAGVHGGGDRPVHRHAGQALAYLTGKLEIERLREDARQPPRPRVLAARLPRRRPRPRLAADANAVPQHRGLARRPVHRGRRHRLATGTTGAPRTTAAPAAARRRADQQHHPR